MKKIITTITIITTLSLFNSLYFAQPARAAFCDDVVAWWSLDEESGARADSAGSNNLTDNNTVLFGTGKVSNAADFERGTSEYLSVADNAALSITGDISFAFWANLETKTITQDIAMKWGAYGGGERSYDINIATDNKITFIFDETGAGSVQTTKKTDDVVFAATATWYHVVITADVSVPTVTFYVNGSEVASTAGVSNATAIFNGDEPFWIGGMNNGSGGENFFDGLVDEFVITNTIMSQTDVDTLYNSGNGAGYDDVCGAPATDSCTPPTSGSVWNVTLTDNCYITDYRQFDGTLNCFGTGRFAVATGGTVVVEKINCNKATVVGTGKIMIRPLP